VVDQAITGQGGGKGGQSQPSFVDQPNSIRSRATARLLMVLSAGPVEGLEGGAPAIRLDGVPLISAKDGSANFSGISWEMREGTSDQGIPGLDGFNMVETTISVSKTLNHGSPVTRSGNGEAARITLRFPGGLVKRKDNGIFGATVRLAIDRRRPDGSWQRSLSETISEKQTALFELQYLVRFEGVYDQGFAPAIRVERLTEDSGDNTRDRVDWVAATWLRSDRLTYAGVSTLALSLSAESTSGRLPEISVDLRGRLLRVPINYDPVKRQTSGLWNGAFKTLWSNNPAWVILDLLTDRDWGMGLKDSLIEIYDLYAVAQYADAQVDDGKGGTEPRFLFDAVIARRLPASQLIQQICAAIRVMMFWSGGRLRFVVDKPAAPVLWLTNHHVEDGAFIYTSPGANTAFSHALVSYTDKDVPGGIAVEAETRSSHLARFGYIAKEVALLGCNRRSQARRHARWLLEVSALDLHSISWNASLDHFAENPIRPGDVVRIYDANRAEAGVTSGRFLRQAFLDAGDLPIGGQVFDQRIKAGSAVVDMEAANGTWVEDVAVTCSDIKVEGEPLSQIVPDAGAWPRTPAKGGAVVIRQADDTDKITAASSAGKEYRVLMVRELDNYRLEVSAIRYDAGLYDRVEKNLVLDDAASAGLPRFDDPVSAATGLSLTQPSRLPEGGTGREIHVGWTPPTDARIAYWRLNATGPDGEHAHAEVAAPPAILRSLAPGAWSCRLVAVDWTGREGQPALASVTVMADPEPAMPPSGAGLAPGYGQLTLIWSGDDLPEGAAVEVLEYSSADATEPQSTSRVIGLMLILPDRTPGEIAYFRLRTILKGGTTSEAGDMLSGAALTLPEPKDGDRGTIMASAQVTSPSWNADLAAAAITQITGDPPRPGDVVTLSATGASGWAETRRFTSSGWEITAPMLAGDQIATGTLPASRLVLDGTTLKATAATDELTLAGVPANLITSGVMQSTAYSKGKSGYRIDTAGKAEFYSAHIRGVLEGSRIESSLLVSATQTIPTEAGGRFITLDVPRPLRYYHRKKQGNILTLGPVDINIDSNSARYGDQHKVVVAADDPVGDSDDGYNAYYARYWAFEPSIKVTASTYRSGQPWGQYVTKARVKAKLYTQSGRVLAESKTVDLSGKDIWKHQTNALSDYVLLSKSDGFRAGSYILITRSTAWENGPGQGRSYTQSLSLTMVLGAKFSFTKGDTEGDGLMMDFLLDFDGEGLTARPINALYLTARIAGTTLD